jgi:hypothetical protein
MIDMSVVNKFFHIVAHNYIMPHPRAAQLLRAERQPNDRLSDGPSSPPYGEHLGPRLLEPAVRGGLATDMWPVLAASAFFLGQEPCQPRPLWLRYGKAKGKREN